MQNFNLDELIDKLSDPEKRALLSADEERMLANIAAQQALVIAGQGLAYVANAPLYPVSNISKANLFNAYVNIKVSAQQTLDVVNKLLVVFNDYQTRQNKFKLEQEAMLDELVAQAQADGDYDIPEKKHQNIPADVLAELTGKYNLDDMLEQVTPENVYSEVPVSSVLTED